MPRNLNSDARIGPLSVGNIVSGSLRLYRDHFKQYYTLALLGSVWVAVPIYGWAKYAAMHGLIARLAFKEVIERPETVEEARRYTEPRLWSFLGVSLLVGLISYGVILLGGIAVGIVLGIAGAILGVNNPLLAILLSVVLGLFLISLLVWLYARLSIAELPIALENNVENTKALSRSWNLTKGFVIQLLGVYLVASLISVPMVVVLQLLMFIIQGILTAFLGNLPNAEAVLFLISLELSIIASSILIPFWQAVKALLYYDIRSRREGMDLELADSQDWK